MISEESIMEMLRSHAGIDAVQTGEASLRNAIRRAIGACAHPGRMLDISSSEWKSLLESVLVPETWFFRNMEAFDALAGWVAGTWLPAHPGAPLRVLSLPCATGEEPFSIAMRLLEAGLAPGSFEIRAGDISEKSLATARAAAYRRNSFRPGFDEPRFGKYFEAIDGGLRRVTGEVRRMVDFQKINLADPSAVIPESDVIFCRNALIYLTEETRLAALARLGAALGDDGILFLGPVEPPVALQCGFVSAGLPMAFACVKNSAAKDSPRPPDVIALRRILRPKQVPGPDGRASRKRPAKTPPRTALISLPSPGPDPASTLPGAASGDSLETARSLADAGQEESAAAMLERMPAPADPDFFCLRGVVSGALGRSDLAEVFYRKALYLDPSHHEARAHLALLLDMGGRAAAASRLRRRTGKPPAR